MSRKNVIYLLLAAIMFFTTIDVAIIYFVKDFGFVRYIAVPDLAACQPEYPQLELIPQNNPDAAIYHLRNVMNKVRKVAHTPSRDISSLLAYVKSGGGLDCSGMADLYLDELLENHIKARQISLFRDLGDMYDSHATVEVYLNGKWVIFDPTFNISFTKNGVLIGAEDIHQALIHGTFGDIKPVFYGEVEYPARVDKYYMHWLSLYNNVFVAGNGDIPFIKKMPPLRYWLGPVCYYQENPRWHNHDIDLHEGIYFVAVVLLPIFIMVLGFLLVALLLLAWRRKARYNIRQVAKK